MDQQKKAISTFQLFAILVRATVGVGLLGMAREVTANAKQDGWIAVLLAGAVAVCVMFLWVLLMERFPQYTILDITECLMGTSSAKVVGGIYTLYYLTGLGIVARELTELMSVWFLEKTPFVVIMSIAMVPVVYINQKGIHCLVHFTEIIFMISIPFILVLFAGVSYLDIYNLMPVGGAGFRSIAKDAGAMIFAYAGCESILFFNPWISDRKQIKKISLRAVLFITGLYVLGVAAQIAFFGYIELEFLLYTVMKYLRSFEIPVIGRIEFLYIFFWTAAISSMLGIHFFMMKLAFKKLTSVKTVRWAGTNWVLAIVVIIIGLAPKNISELIAVEKLFGYVQVVVCIFFPVLLLLWSYVFHKRGDKIDAEKKDL